eukprot:TRINITY_DN550_c0_g1_i1.p1 TRINITY_DN550_c0_g1~~TRINITY_DN550_c0_g1_i1.p1  ORF type:complete len:366 (+),score=66.58 TRINITY_DN550_c0_g1_i1:658-1755(+)
MARTKTSKNDDGALRNLILSEISTKDLAAQMTLMTAKSFGQIRTKELLFPDVLSPSLAAFEEHCDMISSWVIQEILVCWDSKTRTSTLTKFLELAQVLHNLQNFTGVVQVLNALSSAPIAQLKQNWRVISPKLIQQYEKLQILMSPENNFENYKKEVSRLTPPLIPHLGSLLCDLNLIEEHPTLFEGNLVNWTKMRLLGKVLNSFHFLRSKKFPMEEDVSIQRYIKSWKPKSEPELLEMSAKVLDGSNLDLAEGLLSPGRNPDCQRCTNFVKVLGDQGKIEEDLRVVLINFAKRLESIKSHLEVAKYCNEFEGEDRVMLDYCLGNAFHEFESFSQPALPRKNLSFQLPPGGKMLVLRNSETKSKK